MSYNEVQVVGVTLRDVRVNVFLHGMNDPLTIVDVHTRPVGRV